MDTTDASESTFCSYLWQHASVRPGLIVQPCCRFVVADENLLGKLEPDFGNFSEAINSDHHQNIRAKALRGEAIAGCRKCRQAEKFGGISLRHLANREFPRTGLESSLVQNSDIRYLEIFTGSTCNLKCLTCGPELSTSWRSEFEALGWLYKAPPSHKVDYRSLIQQTPGLQQIKFVGGEPFLSRGHSEMLESIASENAKKIKLIYFTNVTVWPDAKTIELWKSFEAIEVWLSIDGFEAVNDYIRFPSKWSDVEANTRRYFELATASSNIKLAVNCTVNVFNVFCLNQLELWVEKMRGQFAARVFHFCHLNPLIFPARLNVSNLSEPLKVTAEAKLNMQSEQQRLVKEHMRSAVADDSLIPSLVEFTRATDRVRKQDVRVSVPELATLF